MTETSISAAHLERIAYIYIRQSTLRQVLENSESTTRQYQLKERAIALGWDHERIVVIDEDLGLSGSGAQWRDGFQYLMAEVSLARAGAIFALEVSRLARCSSDWHRLLEICAMTQTLIVDEDGLYDPRHFNDRFLLGMKGAMSEAELHLLRARLQGGTLNKARRGALQFRLPIGLCYSPTGEIILDPDREVQAALRRVFEVFAQKGSARKVVGYFNENHLLFPHRFHGGIRKGDICWLPLLHCAVLRILHNPRYTGTYVYGRMQLKEDPHSRKTTIRYLAKEKWQVVIPDHGQGYISWEEYEANERRLRSNALALGADRRSGPAREGAALLQGIVICGCCGGRMTIRYHQRRGKLIPDYMCQRAGIEHSKRICQHIPGGSIDQAIEKLLIEKLTPESIEVALNVFEEVKREQEKIKKAHQMRITKLQYEADLASRQYMQVDPANRLVAATLEKSWNEKLINLQTAQDEYERQYKHAQQSLTPEIREQLLELIKDFPKLWHHPKTPQQEKKRILRLMIKDATLIKSEIITIKVRWQAGTYTTIEIPRPLPATESRKTPQQTINRIRELSQSCPHKQIVDILNTEGHITGTKLKFNVAILKHIIHQHGMKSYYQHLRESGKLTLAEMAQQLGVHKCTVRIWHQAGLLTGHVANDKREYLFDPIKGDKPLKRQGVKLTSRSPKSENLHNHSNEV